MLSAELPGVDLAFVVVFLAYGLALFALSGAVVLSSHHSRPTRFSASLKYLAAFGLFGALASWLDAGLVLTDSLASPDAEPVRVAKTILLALAGASLLWFGASLMAHSRRSRRWMLAVPGVMVTAWLVILIGPLTGPMEALSSASTSCLECHQAQPSALVGSSGSWVTSADIWAHYLLYCPGALLAAGAFLAQRQRFLFRGLPGIARNSLGAALGFAVTAVSAGLIVPPSAFFPASLLNYASFHAALRIPTQLVTTVATVLIAYSVVRTLRVFEIERARQLARAREARFSAQREMLDAQRREQARMLDWNRQLEERVRERTLELEALHVRLKDVAVLEERDRIARELHDSLAQALGYLGLRASVLQDLLESGQVAQAADEVRTIAEVIDDAYADVREAILGLRTKTTRLGLVPALREYLRKYGLQTGIHSELQVEADSGVEFVPSVETQLIRVVQEALANVRKHARAERVVVRLWREAEHTCISVEDDGCGFDLGQAAATGHYGLATMRERVEDVDGSLQIRSAPGGGTLVMVCFPAIRLPLGGSQATIASELAPSRLSHQSVASSPAHPTMPTN